MCHMLSYILEQYFFRVKSQLEHHLTSSFAKGLYKEIKVKSLDSETPKLFGLDRQFGQIQFGVFGLFLANLTAPILVLWCLYAVWPYNKWRRHCAPWCHNWCIVCSHSNHINDPSKRIFSYTNKFSINSIIVKTLIGRSVEFCAVLCTFKHECGMQQQYLSTRWPNSLYMSCNELSLWSRIWYFGWFRLNWWYWKFCNLSKLYPKVCFIKTDTLYIIGYHLYKVRPFLWNSITVVPRSYATPS